jgi:hypothetical protein
MRFTRDDYGQFQASGEITAATPGDFMGAGVERGATVLLDSPGGDVEAAMALGRLFRLRKVTTMIMTGESCASACVWAFAGGSDRFYNERHYTSGPLLVHRFHGAEGDNGEAHAQAEVARISRYLDDMGVDHQLLELSLETPSETVEMVPFDKARAWGLDTFPPLDVDGFRPALGGTPAGAAPQAGTSAPALTPQREAARPAPVPEAQAHRATPPALEPPASDTSSGPPEWLWWFPFFGLCWIVNRLRARRIRAAPAGRVGKSA